MATVGRHAGELLAEHLDHDDRSVGERNGTLGEVETVGDLGQRRLEAHTHVIVHPPMKQHIRCRARFVLF